VARSATLNIFPTGFILCWFINEIQIQIDDSKMVRVLAIHGRESSPENKLESFDQNRPTARFVSVLRFYRMQLHRTHPRSHWLINHSRTNAKIFEKKGKSEKIERYFLILWCDPIICFRWEAHLIKSNKIWLNQLNLLFGYGQINSLIDITK